MWQQTSALTEDVHHLSHRLHSSTLQYLGLVPALQGLVAEFSERHGIRVEFASNAMPAQIPAEVALCLFRVVEESLNNIGKHSGAHSARVELAGSADGIHLAIQDAGAGFDPNTLDGKAGLGLVSMRERLRLVQGTLRIDSSPLQGTRIEAWVPSRNLLLVEDNPGDASLIRRMLSTIKGQFRVTHVTKLSEGLELLQKGGVDAVLLDLGLPDSSGVETLARIRAGDPHVPIIVITGLSEKETTVLVLNQGAQGIIAKESLDADLLAQAILREIGRTPGRQKIAETEEDRAQAPK